MSQKYTFTRRNLLKAGTGTLASFTAMGLPTFVAASGYPGKFTWISPRGTIEVMDDYAIWVAKAMGYYDDMGVQLDMQAGPPGGMAVVQFTSVGRADMGFPAPGIIGNSIEQDMGLVSVFGTGALDLFDIAFRPGEGVSDLRELEGKTMLLGSAAWQAIADPMLAAVGVDTRKINYIEAGWPTWTNALSSGQGDCCLAWEGLRASLDQNGLIFDYWLGLRGSPLPSNSQVVRRSDLEDPERRAFLQSFLKGMAMGHEFAEVNPRAAADIVFKAQPAAKAGFGPLAGTKSLMQLHRTFKGDMSKRVGWGDHDLDGYARFFEAQKSVGLLSEDLNPEDFILNDFIEEANNFDRAKVKADAEGYALPDDLASIDMQKVEAEFYNSAIN